MDHTAKAWKVSELGSEWVRQGIEGLSKIKIRLELSGTQSLADRGQRRCELGRTGRRLASECAAMRLAT
jgi:hypothetical protein